MLLLIRPQRLLKEKPGNSRRASVPLNPLLWCLTAFCGFWSGLIIIDAAILLLLSLVRAGGVSLRQAVPVKAAMIVLFSLSTFLIFAERGKIQWPIGIAMVRGSMSRSLLGARLVPRQKANQWIYRCQIDIVAFENIKTFFRRTRSSRPRHPAWGVANRHGGSGKRNQVRARTPAV